MKSTVKTVNQCARELKVIVPSEEMVKAYDAFYKKVMGTASVPGFRKGKVPRHVLESHYAEQAKHDVVERVINDTYQEALSQNEINPISYPKVEDVSFEGGALSYKATCEVRPEIKLKKYTGFSAKRDTISVADEEITSTVDQIREQAAKFVPVEDRDLEVGDFAICDITSSFDGKPEETRKDEWVEIKDNDMFPDFATQMAGMKVDEERDIGIVLPKTFPNKELQGKEASFHVKLKEVKIKNLPELDKNFLQQMGGYESVDAMKEAIRLDIEKKKATEVDRKLEHELLSKIEKTVKCELPESIVEKRIEGLKKEGIQSLTYRGVSEEEAQAQTEAMTVEFRNEATRQVKIAFIIDYIAQAENLDINDKDVDDHFDEVAKRHGQDPARVREYYLEREDRIEPVLSELRNRKVMDFILANSEIK